MRWSLTEYNLLGIQQKAIVVCSQSTLLDIDISDDIIYTLYAYSGYFIEVQVNNTTKRLINILAFNNGEHLDRYIDRIDLNELAC